MVRGQGVGLWSPEAFPAEFSRKGALTISESESPTSISAAASVGVAPRTLSLSPCSGVAAAFLPTLGRVGCNPLARPDRGSRGLEKCL